MVLRFNIITVFPVSGHERELVMLPASCWNRDKVCFFIDRLQPTISFLLFPVLFAPMISVRISGKESICSLQDTQLMSLLKTEGLLRRMGFEHPSLWLRQIKFFSMPMTELLFLIICGMLPTGESLSVFCLMLLQRSFFKNRKMILIFSVLCLINHINPIHHPSI